MMQAGEVVKRETSVDNESLTATAQLALPPLWVLCRWLKVDKVETVEAVAFGVRAKE
jgi:hypothetical protein